MVLLDGRSGSTWMFFLYHKQSDSNALQENPESRASALLRGSNQMSHAY